MQKDAVDSSNFDKRNFSFYGVLQIVSKNINLKDIETLTDLKEMLLQRFEWQILVLAKKPYLALITLPKVLKMDFPEIWSLLFSNQLSFIMFIFRIVNSRKYSVFRKLIIRAGVKIGLR
jgi:hypothetical protein